MDWLGRLGLLVMPAGLYPGILLGRPLGHKLLLVLEPAPADVGPHQQPHHGEAQAVVLERLDGSAHDSGHNDLKLT